MDLEMPGAGPRATTVPDAVNAPESSVPEIAGPAETGMER